MKEIITPESNSKPKNAIRIYPAQVATQSTGNLRVRCTTAGFAPIPNAKIIITSSDNPNTPIDQLTTNDSGLTEAVPLPAPPFDYSQDPSAQQPYSLFNLSITAPGYNNVDVTNVQILPSTTAEQDSTLAPVPPQAQPQAQAYVIPPHTLYGDYPPKIPEPEIKPAAETGAIVLPRVVIPEFIIVHDGPPSDTSAANHYVRFRDYIKNVASSEIYATWPEATLYANVLAILSFTLNRVYTEWYQNQGYNFTITSSTAYDHKWMNGRNIYNNIGLLVDSVFNNYLSRPNVKQPILTQYCDGYKVQCPNWMTQWGSKTLGDQGQSAIQILRHFYGNSIYINTAPEVAGVPHSWPGSNLSVGSRGDNVRTIQQQLNAIAKVYSSIPSLSVDGVYGQRTAAAVRAFQQIFDLPANGIVDLPTWYKLSLIYVGVTRIGEYLP